MKEVFDRLIEENIDKCIDELNKMEIFKKYEIEKCIWNHYNGEGFHYAININYRTDYPKWLIQGYEDLFANKDKKRWVAGALRFEVDEKVLLIDEYFSKDEVNVMTDIISKYFPIKKLERRQCV